MHTQRKSLDSLSFVTRNAGSAEIGTWVWWVKDNRVLWSPEMYKLLEYQQGVDEASVDAFMERVEPSQRQTAVLAASEHVRTGDVPLRQVRLSLPSGGKPLVLISGMALFNEAGEVVQSMGAIVAASRLGPELRDFELPKRSVADLSRVEAGKETQHRLALSLVSTLGARPTLGTSAKALGVSSRSLQRSLENEGTSFVQVLRRVRKERAEFYLAEQKLSLVDVAPLLGFSSSSALRRALQAWELSGSELR